MHVHVLKALEHGDHIFTTRYIFNIFLGISYEQENFKNYIRFLSETLPLNFEMLSSGKST